MSVLRHSGPPEETEEGQGAVDAGEPGGMHPLKDLGAHSIRYVEVTRRASTWIWLMLLGVNDDGLLILSPRKLRLLHRMGVG